MAGIKVLLAVVVVSMGTREGGGRRWKSGEFIGKVNLVEGSGGIFCFLSLFLSFCFMKGKNGSNVFVLSSRPSHYFENSMDTIDLKVPTFSKEKDPFHQFLIIK